MHTPVPIDERSRLEALSRYDVLSPEPDALFDNIVRLAAAVSDTPIAQLGFLDRDQLWIKAAVGVDLSRIPRHASYSAHAICKQRQILVVPDAKLDTRFALNPLLALDPPVRFFAAVPLIEPSGYAIGTLTVMDHRPRDLSHSECDRLHALAGTAMTLLESRQVARRLEAEIAERIGHERDPLTQMSNRRGFFDKLQEEVKRAHRLRYPLSMLKIDIDHFTAVNETFGRQVGEQLLCRVAGVIRKALRNTDTAARCGDDEFAVLLPGTDLRGARNLAERCRIVVDQDVTPRGVAHISVGVAQLAGDDHTGQQLVSDAERSFVRSKQVHRSTELDVQRRGAALTMTI